MFKPVPRGALSLTLAGLTLAGLCVLPVLAEEAQAPKAEARQIEEKGPPARPAFGDIDKNGDGVISQAEFDAFRPQGPQEDHDGPPPGRHRGHSPHGDGRRGPPPPFPDLKRLDTNADGKVSLEEFIAPARARFSEMDANKDGFLDEGELKAPPLPPPADK